MWTVILPMLMSLAFGQAERARDGNELLRKCGPLEQLAALKPTDPYLLEALVCFGYLQGVRDAEELHQSVNRSNLVCIPPAATNGELVLVLLKGLKAQPERLHLRDITLIHSIFVDAFPCRSK